MFWPNSRARRNAMNFGDRKTQINSEAVPAIRTSPTQRLRDRLEPDPPRRLDEHYVAGPHERRHQRGGRARVVDVVRLALEGLEHVRRERPDGHQDVRG